MISVSTEQKRYDMSIFTTTTDHAIDRFTLEDGTEIAVGYDDNPETPFGLGDTWNHIAIRRPYGRDRDWAGDESLGELWDQWIYFEEAELTPEEAEDWLGFTPDRPGDIFDIKVYDLYGHPEFTVIIGNEFWEHYGIEKSDERALKEAEAIAKEWGHWAEGQVFLVEATYPDGDVHYCGNIYEDVTRENIRNYL
jgi:hypothetical protein